jgi:alpha-mannosidase
MNFFTLEKLEKHNQEIRNAIYRETRDIPSFKFLQGDCPGAQAIEFDDRAWDDFRVGDFWGGYDVTAWFRAWVSIPKRVF